MAEKHISPAVAHICRRKRGFSHPPRLELVLTSRDVAPPARSILTGYPQSVMYFLFPQLPPERTIPFRMDKKITILLDTISAETYEARENEWCEALALLRLKIVYIPAIQTVLKQGRWRNQSNPIAYIRKASLWCAIRMELIDTPWPSEKIVLAADLPYADKDGNPVAHDERLDWALVDYEERFGAYYDDESYDSSPCDRVSSILFDDAEKLDWNRAAELAGLDAGERIVLEIQLMGVGREQALSLCYTDQARRFLQAAWKRFVRHQDALKETLLSGTAHQSRRIKRSAPKTPLELVFVELTDGSLKIYFRELVPEVRQQRT